MTRDRLLTLVAFLVIMLVCTALFIMEQGWSP